MGRTKRLAVGLLCLAAALAPARAEENPSTLEGLTLGEHWFGTGITKEDLVGKVVLFVIWGS
jgi:hypothetical protein